MVQIQVNGFRASLIASMMDSSKEPNIKKFLVSDSDGVITMVNEATQAILGYRKSDLIGQEKRV